MTRRGPGCWVLVRAVKDAPSEDLGLHFESCTDFIDSAMAQGGKVLVHCFMGR